MCLNYAFMKVCIEMSSLRLNPVHLTSSGEIILFYSSALLDFLEITHVSLSLRVKFTTYVHLQSLQVLRNIRLASPCGVLSRK